MFNFGKSLLTVVCVADMRLGYLCLLQYVREISGEVREIVSVSAVAELSETHFLSDAIFRMFAEFIISGKRHGCAMRLEREDILCRLLAVTRIVLAWFMIWPFFDKMFGLGYQTPAGQGMIDGGSPSSFVVFADGGLLKPFWDSVGGNSAVDVLMMVGIIAIGIALLLGIGSKIACVAFTVFLLLMYSLHVPPSDNPLIDYRITWILLTWIVYFGKGFEKYSLCDRWKELPFVRKFPILE